jgi:DNA-binding response OmpR family regulator
MRSAAEAILGPRVRISVADDDPGSCALLTAALEGPNVEVRSVDNGASLMQLLGNEGPFDLLITDIVMPWLNGLRALRMMRSAGVKTPIVLVSALPDDEVLPRLDGLAKVQFLRKPFSIAALRAVVAAALGQAELGALAIAG